MKYMIVVLVVSLLLVGCGTFELKGQVLHPEQATATQIAATIQSSQVTPTSNRRNLSPVTFPTASHACEVIFFWGEMPGLCPGMLPTQVDGAFQVYDGGYMLWERATGSVYVLFNGGLGRRVEERIAAGWPEIQNQVSPPANHVSPIRGFGRVWQHEKDIRDLIGWPLGLEQAYTAQFQSAGENSANQYFYMSIPNGQVVEFNSAGAWRIVK